MISVKDFIELAFQHIKCITRIDKYNDEVVMVDRVKDIFNNLQDITDSGELSDGYHSFNELYEFRKLYNAAFFNALPTDIKVHKSFKHSDGKPCFDGTWFIVMAELPTGQISNHYKEEDWNLFKCPLQDTADEWDGHTPEDVRIRLKKYIKNYGI